MAVSWIVWIDEARVARSSDPAALGQQLAAALNGKGPKSLEQPDGFGFLHVEGHALTPHTSTPQLLWWDDAALGRYDFDGNREELREVLRDLGGSGAVDDRPISILVVGAGHGISDPATFGRNVVQLAQDPWAKTFNDGRTSITRSCRISGQESQVLVWFGGVVLPPALMTTGDHAYVLDRLSLGPEAAPDPVTGNGPDLGPLSVIGAVLQGSGFDGFVPVEPGRVTALFGPNGAGKSLVLEALTAALGTLSGTVFEPPRPSAPEATVLFDCGAQERAPAVLKLLFVHLGWSPYTPLGHEVHRRLSAKLPVWSELHAPPPDTDALAPLAASNRALEDLRRDVRDAVVMTSPWGPVPGAGALVDAFMSSSILAVAPAGLVGLAVLPHERRNELFEAATEFFSGLKGRPDTALVNVGLSVWRLAKQIINGDDKPVISPMAPVAHLQPLVVAQQSGWVAAGEALLGALGAQAPRPVRFDPWPGPGMTADGLVEQHAIAILAGFGDPDPGPADDNPPHPFASPLAPAVLSALAEQATGLLPAFIRSDSSLRIELEETTRWHKRRCIVQLARTDNDGELLALDLAPAGIRTWGYAAISFAAAQLATADWTATSGLFGTFVWHPSERHVVLGNLTLRVETVFGSVDPDTLTAIPPRRAPVVYLLDEPEAHLHLTAQQDVVRVTAELAASGGGAVAATHSLAFLNAAPATQVVTVSRRDDETRLSSPSGLRDLVSRAEELGVPASAFAQACRAVLAVEGINDAAMLRQYSGIDLDAHLVHISVMQGSTGAPKLAELEFLHAMQIRIVVLLDHVRRSQLVSAIEGGMGRFTGEERLLSTLHDALVRGRLAVAVLPFAPVDIACAVPDAEIDWAVQQLGGPPFRGWTDTLAATEKAWERDRISFKASFAAEAGADLDRVLRTLRESGRKAESPQLKGLLSTLLAYVDDGALSSGGLTVLNPYRPGRGGSTNQ